MKDYERVVAMTQAERDAIGPMVMTREAFEAYLQAARDVRQAVCALLKEPHPYVWEFPDITSARFIAGGCHLENLRHFYAQTLLRALEILADPDNTPKELSGENADMRAAIGRVEGATPRPADGLSSRPFNYGEEGSD